LASLKNYFLKPENINKKKYIDSSMLKHSFNLLSSADKTKIILIVTIQILLGLLDLIGVGLIGVLGALSVSGIRSDKPGDRVSYILNLFNLENTSFQQQITIIGAFAALFMITKTLASMYFTKKTLAFLGIRSAIFSAELLRKIATQKYSLISNKSKQETIFSLTSGSNSLILGVLGSIMTIVSDLSLILIMLTGLFIIEPKVAVSSLLFFALISLSLHKKLSNRAEYFGVKNALYSIKVNELISDLLDTYRELYLRNQLGYQINDIEVMRRKLAKVSSGMAFLPYISKYVLEISVVIGVLCLAVYQFIAQDAGRAVGNLALFLAASSRIVPSILRLQQGFLQIKSSTGGAKPTYDLYKSIPDSKISAIKNMTNLNFEHLNFEPTAKVTDISYRYPDSTEDVITDLSIDIPNGSFCAVVGKSGAGKSTLANLILGAEEPSKGQITISGLKPSNAIQKWPGAVSYVPQDVVIINASIFQNISLSPNTHDEETIKKVWRALEIAQLTSFVQGLPSGIDSVVGEKGTKLSGGQRQRIGIARAVFTNPKILIMDEATSSLDAETEHALNLSILGLKGSVTLFIIAHRLATIRHADKIYYIDNGVIQASGSFEQVRTKVLDFDLQAKLLGL
jgi:ABC-type multidrug transport system fused ATPase/permease subunit